MKIDNTVKKFRIKKWCIVIVCVIILSSVLVSYAMFRTFNPISTLVGLARIVMTDTEYVEIQKNSRVILAKSNDLQEFIDFIESEGYTYSEDKRLGAMHFIEKNGVTESVLISGNGYYTKWIWQ